MCSLIISSGKQLAPVDYSHPHSPHFSLPPSAFQTSLLVLLAQNSIITLLFMLTGNICNNARQQRHVLFVVNLRERTAEHSDGEELQSVNAHSSHLHHLCLPFASLIPCSPYPTVLLPFLLLPSWGHRMRGRDALYVHRVNYFSTGAPSVLVASGISAMNAFCCFHDWFIYVECALMQRKFSKTCFTYNFRAVGGGA